jgi:c-di-AMP phosphodiesterase-like protein
MLVIIIIVLLLLVAVVTITNTNVIVIVIVIVMIIIIPRLVALCRASMTWPWASRTVRSSCSRARATTLTPSCPSTIAR